MPRKVSKAQTERVTVAYLRVSTQEQAQNGHSLDAQRTRLTSYAAGTGRQLARVYVDDGYSAGTLKRAGIQELLSDIKAGQVATLLVTKLDRLSRSLLDLLEVVRLCERYKVALVSASEAIDTSTPAGRMMLQLLGVFAEFERARIGERISDVLADRRSKRRVYSRNVPFGYRRNADQLEPDERQQEILAKMRSMRATGASLREIAAYVNNLSLKTNNGGERFYPQTVKQVLSAKIHGA